MLDSIFGADSPLIRVLSRFADVVVLNLVFVATSLPVITLGASLTALNATAAKIVRGRTDAVAGDYLAAFRANFRGGSKLGLVVAGLGGVLAAWYVVVTFYVASPTLQLVLLAGWFLLALQLAGASLFAFAYLATFEDDTRRVLRNALLMSWRHPLATLTVAAVTGLPVVITVFYPRMSGYGLLWLFVGFGAVAVISAMVLTRVFDRYLPTPEPTPEPDPAPVTQDGPTRALP
jgi:uncharacterized membrane protein YesL